MLANFCCCSRAMWSSWDGGRRQVLLGGHCGVGVIVGVGGCEGEWVCKENLLYEGDIINHEDPSIPCPYLPWAATTTISKRFQGKQVRTCLRTPPQCKQTNHVSGKPQG